MSDRPETFNGIGASSGVAIGHVFVLDRRTVRVPRYHILPQNVEREISRIHTAIEASVAQLESIRSQFIDDGMDHSAILEAHEMMLKDAHLLQETTALVTHEHLNAEWAVNNVISRLRGFFEHVDDPYIRERRGDIDFIGQRLLRNLVGKVSDITELEKLEAGTIVVAYDLTPADTALLAQQKITAFVTDAGSRTSHTSIIARSMDVPAVVGAKGVFQEAGNNDVIIVDGIDGTVQLRPSKEQLKTAQSKSVTFTQLYDELLASKDLPARTIDGHTIHIAGNIELPDEATNVFAHGGESIGLYRTEFLYVERKNIPDEDAHYQAYRSIFEAVGNELVTIRTVDLGADKIFGMMNSVPEGNPALGLRGIRYCLQNDWLFKSQLKALLRAGVHGNLRILLPMVSTVQELRHAKELLAEAAAELRESGHDYRENLPIGCMIEVPSAVLTADILAKECDFMALGTNDLLQYLLAIDRTNEQVAYLYQPLQPAVLRTLKMIVEITRDAGIPLSICGEMAGETALAPILVGFGLDELSMNAGSIPWIKNLIRNLRRDECERLVADALLCSTEMEVQNLVRDFMRRSLSSEYDLWKSTLHFAPTSPTA